MLKVSTPVQSPALGFKNKTCLFVLIASSWWLIHTIPLTFGNAHMPPQHLLFSPFSMSKGPTLLFPCPHLILSVNYQAVQFDTSLCLALCSALRSALHGNYEDAWLKMFMLSSCPKAWRPTSQACAYQSSMRPMVQR